MKTIALFPLAVVLLATPLAAQDRTRLPTSESISSRFASMENENAELRERLEALENANFGCDTCNDGCDSCCRSAGFFGGAEVCFLKPYTSRGPFTGYFTGISSLDIVFDDPEPGSRFWLGYSGSSGLGLQVRVWEFDNSTTMPSSNPFTSEEIRLDLSVFDVEVTNATELGYNWDALVTAGFRHVEYDVSHIGYAGSDIFTGTGRRSDMNGVTVSGEIRRGFLGNLTLFANARGSAVFGDTTQYTPGGSPGSTDRGYVKYILESQLGAEWRHPLAGGGLFFVRGAAEVQSWERIQVGTEPVDNLGLFGGTFAIGVQR